MFFDLLEECVQKYKTNTAICFDNRKIDYLSLHSDIVDLGEKLLSKGITKGENVAVIIENSIEYIKTFFAINYCNAVIVPIHLNMGIQKLISVINFYNIKHIITTISNKEMFDEALLRECIELKSIFYLNNHNSVTMVLNQKKDLNYCYLEGDSSDNTKGKSTILILFSSGTTNIPKGIMLSGDNVIGNMRVISEYLCLEGKDRILLIKSLNHASSITGELLVSLYNGCTLYLTSKIPTSSLILHMIAEERITVFFAVPSILINLLSNRHINRLDLLSLRIIHFYGSSMPVAKIKELFNTFYETNIIYSYGLTEASPRVTYISKEALSKRLDSSGRPINGVELFILDEGGNVLSNNRVGEIVVKGSNIMQGYYKNEALTNKVLKDGLLYTGDLGYLDEDGFLYVTGRKDNQIIISGRNIYPEEIESVLYNYPGIIEVMVRGESSDNYDMRLVAYFVAKEGMEIDIKKVFDFCRQSLEDYKLPREIFKVKELRKTLSGKIIRKGDVIINYA